MKKAESKKIRVIKDGPYLVTGNPPLARAVTKIGADNEPEKWETGPDYPRREAFSLCRCGRSNNKPFCDGTHIPTAFDGTETAPHKNYLDLAEKNVGPGLDLTDAACFCSIARFCHRAGDTWTLTEKSDDPEAKRIAVEEAGDCPSGRLVAWDKETGTPLEPPFEPSLGLIIDTKHMAGGPLWVKGGIPVESADGFTYEVRNRVTLCRCGESKNKPFCDGTHVRIRFDDGDPSIKLP
jgi:CDGSH-type Zn-finger protein